MISLESSSSFEALPGLDFDFGDFDGDFDVLELFRVAVPFLEGGSLVESFDLSISSISQISTDNTSPLLRFALGLSRISMEG